MGWPDDTPDMRRFYPTSVMETGPDILFFWVARMMMLGLFCTDVEPFHTVYLHGIVRGEGGVKMSKTKGNVVDPLEVVERIGADALRYALVAGTAPGMDQRLTAAKLDGARNFTNKLWNATRFVLGSRPEPLVEPEGEPSLAERWIASRLAAAQERATRQLDDLDMSGYAGSAYEFAWSEFCDWFLEMAKVELRRPDASEGERARVWHAAADALAGTLRILHPLMPFVTEQAWSFLREADPRATDGEPLLVSARWNPGGKRDSDAEAAVGALVELVRGLRNLRTETGMPPGEWRHLVVAAADPRAQEVLAAGGRYLEALARGRPLEVLPPGAEGDRPGGVVASPLGPAWYAADVADPEAAARRRAQAEHLGRGIDRLRQLLGNESFTGRAPADVVERERARLAELEAQLRQLGAD
jgi:valyl-tRNA synthetase